MTVLNSSLGSHRAFPWIAAVVLAIGFAPDVRARAEAGEIRFSHVTLEDGLSQESVNCILQDDQGLMWFGTQDGLNRYDGYNFTVYKRDLDDPTSLSNNFVWAIHIDRDGVLWVGTEGGGLNRFDAATERFTAYRHDPGDMQSISHDRVRAIFEDDGGALWVGTEGGLNRMDRATGTFTRFLHDPSDPTSLGHNQVRSIHQDRDGVLWIGTDGGGLNRFEPETGSFRRFIPEPHDSRSLRDPRIRVIYEDRDGALWIGTYNSGLSRFDRHAGTFDHYSHDPDDPNSLSHDRVRAIFEDSQGTLWVGTDGGLNRWMPYSQSFTRYRNDPANPRSLLTDRVMAISQDRGGLLWVSTLGGLNRWNPTIGSFSHYRQDPNAASTFSSNTITAIGQDEQGAVWIGTFGGGLNRFDRARRSVTHYRHQPGNPRSLSDDRVMSLRVDRSGVVWVGTMEGGLSRLDRTTGTFRHFRHDPEDPTTLSANGVTAIHEGRDGALWVATYRGGLNRLDRRSGRFTRYRHDPGDPRSLANDRVMVVYQESSGAVWVGTEGSGLDRLDPATGRFTNFKHDPDDPRSLGSNVVWSIHEDRNGVLWIGTQGGGINAWDPADRAASSGVFRRYTESDGLSNDFIYAILEDDEGNLWLSSNKGLSRFDPRSGTFRNYDTTHGLQSNEFNFGAYHRGPDGEMFFGGSNGFNAFYPWDIHDNAHVPPVVLTGIYKMNKKIVLGRPIWEADSLRLGYKDVVVSFEFAALDFSAPNKNRYAYKLEGFDEDWFEVGNMRRATYTNLDAGEYVFRVRGSNNDGVWNEQGASIAVKVLPPPWETWWAYSLYAACLIGVVLGYTRAQQKKLHREAEYSRKLEAEVKARTAELAQRNLQLEEVNEKLEQASLTDQLTGLRNRRYLMNYLQQDISLVHRRYAEMIRNGGEWATTPPDFLFLMIDLDGFKEINDTYGHAAGDAVLTRVRELMEAACRESDTIIRWGGDEFLIVCRNVDRSAAQILAERIRRTISGATIDIGEGHRAGVGCSIGFAFYPFVATTPTMVGWERAIAIADRALYIAKGSGKNAWVGILSTDKPAAEDFSARIIDAPEEVAAEGYITLSTSLPEDGEVIWKPA